MMFNSVFRIYRKKCLVCFLGTGSEVLLIRWVELNVQRWSVSCVWIHLSLAWWKRRTWCQWDWCWWSGLRKQMALSSSDCSGAALSFFFAVHIGFCYWILCKAVLFMMKSVTRKIRITRACAERNENVSVCFSTVSRNFILHCSFRHSSDAVMCLRHWIQWDLCGL